MRPDWIRNYHMRGISKFETETFLDNVKGFEFDPSVDKLLGLPPHFGALEKGSIKRYSGEYYIQTQDTSFLDKKKNPMPFTLEEFYGILQSQFNTKERVISRRLFPMKSTFLFVTNNRDQTVKLVIVYSEKPEYHGGAIVYATEVNGICFPASLERPYGILLRG